MKNDRIIDSSKLHVLSIKTIKGNINAELYDEAVVIDGHQFNINIEDGFDFNKKIMGITIEVNIQAVNNVLGEVPVTGSYTHEIIFEIDNLQDFIDTTIENEITKYVMDASMAVIPISIAYSTIRGIIFNRTQGTPLGSVILPIIDPKEFLKNK